MILERYLYREVLRSFAAVFTLLLLIYLSSRFVRYLADAAAGKISPQVIFELLSLKLVTALPTLVPLCLYLAVLLALGRLIRDRETTAMDVAGLGTPFLTYCGFKLAAAFALVVLALVLYVGPAADERVRALESRAQTEADLTGIGAGRFKEFSQGERILYVEQLSADKTAMENVFLHVRQGGRLGVLTSDEARLEYDPRSGDRYAIFSSGNRYMGVPGALDYSITHYEVYAVRLEQRTGGSGGPGIGALPTALLWASDHPAHRAEMQWRLSMPLSVLLLTVFAVLLGRTALGSGRYLGLLSAVMVYFTYSNILGFAKTLVRRDDVAHWIGLWWVHLLFMAVLVLMFFYPALRRRFMERRASALAGAPE